MNASKQQGKDGWNECEQATVEWMRASNKGRMDGMNASKQQWNECEQATREGWME
jgi:hypothetical protein